MRRTWWVRGDYTLTEYLNDVTRENVEVLAEYGRNYCSVTIYTYGNERIAATTFNGYGFHFGCHDHGYHNIFDHYEKWHDRWQIKDRWHNNHHGNRPRTAEATYNYSNADKFKATYGSYSSYHSGKYCGHKWKTAMSKIYYLYDGHGSVERVHGKDGSTFRFEYDTYGNLVAGIVERWHVWYNDIFAHRTVNIYAYSGERYNVISDLQFLRARWYDTDTGRFISEDSYLGTQENPLSRNRYIYTNNNPVNYVDPSGHWVTIKEEEKLWKEILSTNGARLQKQYGLSSKQLFDKASTYLSALHELRVNNASVENVLDLLHKGNEQYLIFMVDMADKMRKNADCGGLVESNAIYVLDEYLNGNISEKYAEKYISDLSTEYNDLFKIPVKDGNNYQRYDNLIKGWVRYYNIKIGDEVIDSNIIKAMMFVETKIGYYVGSKPSVNANSKRDVMQALDPRNLNIYSYINIQEENVRVVVDNDTKEYDRLARLSVPYLPKDNRVVYDGYGIINRLFNTKEDGTGHIYNESSETYYYQYEKATPFLSIAIGVDTFRRKLKAANNNNKIAITNYNGGGDSEYCIKVFKTLCGIYD